MSVKDYSGFFLPGVPVDHVVSRLKAAGGNELEAKFLSPESSAALAANMFGWFKNCPKLLAQPIALKGLSWDVVDVEIEYCARFPWRGGRSPWLDACIETSNHLIGIESKRFEPFRDQKVAAFSDAYWRPKWGDEMSPFTDMRDSLRANPRRFIYLDAAQLVKHALGLRTQGAKRGLVPHLLYLFAEPDARAGQPISAAEWQDHRSEIELFSQAVSGAEVGFSASSYREWLSTMQASTTTTVRDHAHAVITHYRP